MNYCSKFEYLFTFASFPGIFQCLLGLLGVHPREQFHQNGGNDWKG